MNNIKSLPLVIGLGELLWDCFEDERRPGGAPANVAFQANQLGCLGTVVTRVGQDDLGTELLEFNEDLAALMPQSQAVCFGTLAQREAGSREAIHQCLSATNENCLVVYDVNLRQHYYERSWIERSLTAAKMVKLNQDEAGKLGEVLGLSADGLEQFANHVQGEYGLEAVCITRGAEGCLIYAGDQEFNIPGSPVEVADAVGAGDAFTAALISRRLLGWGWEQAALFANRIGGLVASQPGAMPVLKQEFEQISQEIQNS